MKQINATNGRFYQKDENTFYPSATTILSVLPMSPFLKEYLQKHTKEEADRLLEIAGLQGSKIHHTIDLVLRGETIFPVGISKKQLPKTALVFDEDRGDKELLEYLKKPFTEKEDKMMRGFFNWAEVLKPKTIESETIIFSDKYGYAGTVDWIGEITMAKKKKGKLVEVKELCIVDWKTGKGLYESYDMQVSAYLKAYCEMNTGKKGFKKPKRAFLLQLGVNKCGYRFYEIKDVEARFKDFLHTLKTWRMVNKEAKPRAPYNFLNEYKL